MEKETLTYLYKELTQVLANYNNLDALKKDILDYSFFMKEMYAYPNYFSEFYAVKKKLLEYLILKDYHLDDFTVFQQHFFLRCLFEHHSFEDLDMFIQMNMSDEEMLLNYQKYFRK